MTDHVTVSADYPINSYVVVGTQSTFSFDFTVFAKTDLHVAVDGVELDQAEFSFAGSTARTGGYQGGTVTLNSPVSAATVLIWSAILPARDDDFADGHPLDMTALNTVLDKMVARQRDQRWRLDRSLAVPAGEAPIGDLPAAADRASHFLAFDGEGEPIAAAGASGVVVSSFMETLLDDTSAAAARATLGVMPDNGEPLVIVAFGQSNFARSLTYAWTPPENLSVWNVAQDGTSLGTAFAAASGAAISTPVSLAAEFARANPGRHVYLINASASAMAIAQWLPAPTGTDMYAFLKTNVEAALTVLGLTKLPTDTIFASWQGESDAGGPQNYIANRNTLLARLRAETWCPYACPHIVFGISDYINSTFSAFNNYLAGYCSTNPGTHIYVHTATLPITYWDPADANPYIHCLAAGYWAAGVLGYQNFVGPHRALMQGWTVDPKTGNTSFGAGAANTTHRLYMENNVAATTSFYVRNGYTGSGAFAALYLSTDAGTLSISAAGTANGSNIFENWTGAGARTSRAPGFSFQRSDTGKEGFRVYSSGGIGLSSEGTNNYNLRMRHTANITTDRTLYLDVGDTADRTMEIGGNIALNKAKTPAANGDLVIEATNNTTLTFRYKGSDGTVRSGTVTLS